MMLSHPFEGGIFLKIPQKHKKLEELCPTTAPTTGPGVDSLQFLKLFTFNLRPEKPQLWGGVVVEALQGKRQQKDKSWTSSKSFLLLIFLGEKIRFRSSDRFLFCVFAKTGFFVEACSQQRHLLDFFYENKNSSKRRPKL